MANQNWISLFEYSVKYGVSLSTLRRRIKTHSVLFKLDGGKYFLIDENPDANQPVEKNIESVAVKTPASQPQISVSAQPISAISTTAVNVEASVLSSANRLVEELKAAYAKILQEKEEQIGILKEEIVDLKMLVTLLESQVNTTKMGLEKTGAEPALSPAPVDMSTSTFFFPEIES